MAVAKIERKLTFGPISDDEVIEYAHATSTSIPDEPHSFKEAMSRPDAHRWKTAMGDEIKAMESNGVWELTSLPKGHKAIGSKWVMKIKQNSDGSIERYKARLVAQGFTQQPYVDYKETFASVAKFASLRAILAIAAIEDLEVHSMDISNAFLNGDLEEEVYLKQPEGFAVPGQEDKVLRLRKSLYGLKQSPRAWYKHLAATFKEMGFKKLASDASVWIWAKDGVKIIIPVYVDDLTLVNTATAAGRAAVAKVKVRLAEKYKLRDLGLIEYLLGIRITRDRKNRRMYLDQSKFCSEVLRRFQMEHSRPVSTPLSLAIPLVPNPSPDVDKLLVTKYLQIIGSLMYLAIGTRPDISHAVGALSRFNANPSQDHYRQALHVLRYLVGTQDMKLVYGAGPTGVKLSVYSDADWGGDKSTYRSTSGSATYIGECLVNWRSRRQDTVAGSTAHAEIVAANEAGYDGVWFRAFLEEIGYPQHQPTSLYIDNQTAIRFSENPEFHSQMKALAIRYHWLREQVTEVRSFDLKYIETKTMRADVFTKPLVRSLHDHHCSLLGLELSSSS